MSCIRKNAVRIAWSRDELECARDFMFRPSLTESSQSVGARTSREGAMSNICWTGGAAAARRISSHSPDPSADAASKNAGHLRSISQLGVTNTQNMLLRKAIANRMTRQSAPSKIPVSSSAKNGERSTARTSVLKARIVFADTPPIIGQPKRGNGNYEVPPDPIPLTFHKSDKTTSENPNADSVCAPSNSNDESTKITTPSTSEPDAMIASLLANAAWYRDINGRTGFVPTEWRSAPNVQTSSVKKTKSDRRCDVETQSDIACHVDTVNSNTFRDRRHSTSCRLIIRRTEKSVLSEAEHLHIQRLYSMPPDTNGGSSSSQASRHSHKSVTFAPDVTEIGAEKSMDDELQLLLDALRLAKTETTVREHNNNRNEIDENNRKQENKNELAKPKDSSTAASINPMALMPPLPPPRSPKNARHTQNVDLNALNAIASPSYTSRPWTIIRSTSGYLADNSVVEQQADDIVTRPNTLHSEMRQSSRSLQDQQMSYYDNVTPSYSSLNKNVEFSHTITKDTPLKILDSKIDNEFQSIKQSKLKKLSTKLRGRRTRKDSHISGDSISGVINSVLCNVATVDVDRRDSMLDSDSRESVVSAASLHAEKHFRDIFE